jgi:hypothetical protein
MFPSLHSPPDFYYEVCEMALLFPLPLPFLFCFVLFAIPSVMSNARRQFVLPSTYVITSPCLYFMSVASPIVLGLLFMYHAKSLLGNGPLYCPYCIKGK